MQKKKWSGSTVDNNEGFYMKTSQVCVGMKNQNDDLVNYVSYKEISLNTV